MNVPSSSVGPAEILRSRREVTAFLAARFPRLPAAQREEVVQDALMGAWRVSTRQTVHSFPALAKTIAWYSARRAVLRSRHRACPALLPDVEPNGSYAAEQEVAARITHDLPGRAFIVSHKLGGRQPQKLHDALLALLQSGRTAEEVAKAHSVDRGLLCRARALLLTLLTG